MGRYPHSSLKSFTHKSTRTSKPTSGGIGPNAHMIRNHQSLLTRYSNQDIESLAPALKVLEQKKKRLSSMDKKMMSETGPEHHSILHGAGYYLDLGSQIY